MNKTPFNIQDSASAEAACRCTNAAAIGAASAQRTIKIAAAPTAIRLRPTPLRCIALARASGFILEIMVVVPVAGFGMRCAASILSQKAWRQPDMRTCTPANSAKRCFQITKKRSAKTIKQIALLRQHWQLLARIANHLFHTKFHTTRREDSYIVEIPAPLIFSHRRNAGFGILGSRRIDYLAVPLQHYSD
ncbi:hypothetical protein [Achromobacter anxifer]|uniref:hypothetical protein n=1 Tax=Achromobacter anxifer TaxID=1287737 RepID=UPI0023F7D4A2|nr:hypothetical protein [Achromobacter anxifer]MDF8365878.1 hypothetical protein [Achromobacter anxifer]